MESKNELLHDILQEAAPKDFRAALLAETLGQVRRRKGQRHRNRMIVSVLAVIAVAITFWSATLPQTPTPPLVVNVSTPDPLIIRLQAMADTMVVATDPQSVESIPTSFDTVALVRTVPGKKLFKTIGDDELLTLLAGRPVILIRSAPGQAELHFGNPEDSRELFFP